MREGDSGPEALARSAHNNTFVIWRHDGRQK